jgi:hypothetical protein
MPQSVKSTQQAAPAQQTTTPQVAPVAKAATPVSKPAVSATTAPQGFNASNVMKMPGMEKYAKPAVAKPANFSGGPTGYANVNTTFKQPAVKPTKQTTMAEDDLDENCWKGYHKEGNKELFGKTVPNCVKNEDVAEEQHSCPHCGGEMVSEELMNEKKDACYYKVKSRYKVWPSAYASGALVKCRKKGASNWGTGGKKNESSILEGINRADESLHDWFNKEKWVRMDTKGKIKGPCAREPGEGKPKCLPQSKAHSLGKKGRASAAQRKRREDPNPERSGKAINVNTKKQSNESIEEGWRDKLGAAALTGAMALGAAGAQARVTPGDDPNINRLTGKPNITQPAQTQTPAKAEAPKGFSKEYLQSVVNGTHPRPMISVEKAQELLKQGQ